VDPRYGEGRVMELVAFFVLAVLAVGSALLVITHRNQVISALALAFNLVAIAGFYFLLGAQIIGFLQLIVYAGAIMVLIVFVIMLLNIGEEGHLRRSGKVQRFAAPVLTLLFAAVLGVGLMKTDLKMFGAEPDGYGTVEALGKELFGELFYPFEVLSLLLIVAMVGAVLLAKRKL
jgi:NADH-quinone oxidoreductase subunit J